MYYCYKVFKLKEYRNINDLPSNLLNEIKDNEDFFNDFDGKSLDEQQRIACVLNDCDLEIIAGAGCGKTQTLIAKSSYLIERKNIDPSQILCVSFSNASVKDLAKRLKYDIETSTIHSLGNSIIRNNLENRHIINDSKFKKIFNEYLNEASDKELSNLEDYCKNYLAAYKVRIKLHRIDPEKRFRYLIKETKVADKIYKWIKLFKGQYPDASHFKNILKKCEENLKIMEYHKNLLFLNIATSVYMYYHSFMKKNHMIDFEDMINKAINLIEKDETFPNYKYIFVDEYQDMSRNRFLLLKAIKEKTNAHLVVVGDDWQSIYGFEGSDISLFSSFGDYFQNANRVFIEKTYRNSQQLIDIAGKFIMKNDNLLKKELISDKKEDKPIKIVYHEEEDADLVYNLISNLSASNKVMILGRYRNDIKTFLNHTNLIVKNKSRKNIITDKNFSIKNVEFNTVHNAKGLEADYIILIQVTNDYRGFPNQFDSLYCSDVINDYNKSEEERRLFYVALTRAKKGVYIFTNENRESKFVTELKYDNPNSLGIIHCNDLNTYSYLSEFHPPESLNKFDDTIKTETSLMDDDFRDNENFNYNCFITVANNNFKKLLNCNVGDEITIHCSDNAKNLEIIKIENPNQISFQAYNIIKVSKFNFNSISNLNVGEIISIRNKYFPGEILLKIK